MTIHNSICRDKFSNGKVMTAWEAENNKIQRQQPGYPNARKVGKEHIGSPEEEHFESKSPKKMTQKK